MCYLLPQRQQRQQLRCLAQHKGSISSAGTKAKLLSWRSAFLNGQFESENKATLSVSEQTHSYSAGLKPAFFLYLLMYLK